MSCDKCSELERRLGDALKALQFLRNEAKGSMGLEGVRSYIGNSNFAILAQRCDEADAVLHVCDKAGKRHRIEADEPTCSVCGVPQPE